MDDSAAQAIGASDLQLFLRVLVGALCGSAIGFLSSLLLATSSCLAFVLLPQK